MSSALGIVSSMRAAISSGRTGECSPRTTRVGAVIRGRSGQQSPDEIPGGIGRRRRPLALAVAPLVEGDRVEPVRERRNDPIEPVSVRRAAMEEADGRRTIRADLQELQSKAVERLRTTLRRLASQQLTCHGGRLYGVCESVKRATQSFSWRVSTASLLSEQEMLEVPTGPATIRPMRDAVYTVGLLAAAILSGYGLLAPE